MGFALGGWRRLVQFGDRADFDEGFDVPQAGDAHGGHSRIVAADQAFPDAADLADVGFIIVDVDDVDGDADQIVTGAAGGFECGHDVAQRLFELFSDRVTDDDAVGVEGGLSGQINRACPAAGDGVAEALGRAEFGWVNAFERHDCTAPPSTLIPCALMAPLLMHAHTASATSSGSTRRSMGCRRSKSRRASPVPMFRLAAMASTV